MKTLDDIIIIMVQTSVYDPSVFYMEQIAYWMILTGKY